MSLVDIALSLLRKNKPVFPVVRQTKKPWVAWKPYQDRLPTREEVVAWWTQWPDANIGMATGRLSGLMVVDSDSEEAVKRFIESYPEGVKTLRARTGREGGQHFYFWFEEGITNDAGKILGLGIDIRGQGGFVIVPPSIHGNGKAYQWINRNEPLPLPPELRDLLVNRSANGSRSNDNPPAVGERIIEGQRNATLISLAGTMRRRGMGKDAILAALREENKAKCDPALSEQEVEAIGKSVVRYPAGNGKTERQEPIPAVAEMEDEIEPLDTTPTAFPEAAWSGIFGQWRDTVAPCTEAPLEYLWGAFLVAVGLMLGRTVYRRSPRPLYPNFYLLLLGATGDSRKSTVLWLASELLKYIGEDVEILTGIVSTEGLFERLAKREDTRGLGYVDELRSLLSVGRRKGTQDLLPKLNSLYSCPARETIDRREKVTTVVRPFFSIAAATAQEYVEDLFGNLEVVGGVLNRFLVISGPEQEPKPNVRPPSEEAWEKLAAPLREIRDRFDSDPGERDFSSEAHELWNDFYVQWRMGRKQWSSRAANLTARTHEHIQKIALVYSALANESEISARSLATAIAVGGWLEKTTLRLFGDVGMDRQSKAQKVIVERLKKHDRPMFVRDLQRAVSARIPGRDFRDAIRILDDNDQVQVYDDEQLSGQKRKVISLVCQIDSRHLSSSETREKVSGVY